MIVIIQKGETRFWHIYSRLLLPIGVFTLVLFGSGVVYYQSAQSPPQMSEVLFRASGTAFCIAAFVLITFGGPLVLTMAVLTWRRLRAVFGKQM